eukprot:8878384-Lingulodinium_polyedra.AAC.1
MPASCSLEPQALNEVLPELHEEVLASAGVDLHALNQLEAGTTPGDPVVRGLWHPACLAQGHDDRTHGPNNQAPAPGPLRGRCRGESMDSPPR